MQVKMIIIYFRIFKNNNKILMKMIKILLIKDRNQLVKV